MSTTITAPTPTKIPVRPPKDRGEARPLFEPAIVRRAALDAFLKLDPRQVAKNPVMFVVEVGTVLSLIFTVALVFGRPSQVSVTYLLALDVIRMGQSPRPS